jgi:hypothetical protein
MWRTSVSARPQNVRRRRMRHAVSAPWAPRKVWASSKTRNSSGASGEDPDVLAAGQEELELLDVRQQDARLPALSAHRGAARALLGRQQRGRQASLADLLKRSL